MEKDEDGVKLKLYELIISRYREKIEESENRGISELRTRISPYNEFVKQLNERLCSELTPYEYEKHFPIAVQKAIEYIKSIKNIELPVTFWLEFETIDELKAGNLIDQALLLTSLLRSFGSQNAKIFITKSKKVYVGYSWKDEQYLINPESGSLLRGEDVQTVFFNDSVLYTFSDLCFETYGTE